ncbi:MAG: 2-isopropylmalate synthase [Candidatus Marinimicrobia bacterium]|nr:2-isopropylmalate synthase [Candidatus Neomarinimicrobiota bacterium]
MKEKIIIFDTTLRDGEQSPGASLNVNEKVEIAHQLVKLNVDVIEAGFPISSMAQFDAVQQISNSVDAVITGLARAIDADIKSAGDALQNAKKKRIHTFIGTSDIHINGKFEDLRYGHNINEKRKTIIKMACNAVKYAKTFTDDIEFSPEDAGRTDIGFLAEIIYAVIESGATTVNIPDTTGYTMPHEFGMKINELKQKVSNINKAVISVHCHNDLGLAVANSMNAISNGARQIECTINGIGERAGNASLEEVVMALKVRSDYWDFYTDIKTEEIYNSSCLVSRFTGILIQPNKAIVGENAFSHEAGIHQDGILKNKNTYEIMVPSSVGITQNKIVLGRHSGKHGLSSRLETLGYSPSKEKLNNVYQRFLELADKKKEVYDEDLRILMGKKSNSNADYFKLEYLHVNIGTSIIPTATVRIEYENKIVEESSTGDGPVSACIGAIKRSINIKESLTMEHYQVRSISVGKEAQGEVILRLRSKNGRYSGRGISTDTIEASAIAYLNALNKFVALENKDTSFKTN